MDSSVQMSARAFDLSSCKRFSESSSACHVVRELTHPWGFLCLTVVILVDPRSCLPVVRPHSVLFPCFLKIVQFGGKTV